MPLDAICLTAVREELAGRITGLKIDKVQQPERDIIILTLRGDKEPLRLLISAGAGDTRVHITGHRFENPASPPMFCMLLRKRLTGARIVSITQPPAERLLTLVLEAPDAFGEISEKHLILELMGRLPNIVLTDCDGRIIDCLRRIGGELTDKRAVLPGLFYRPPPAQAGKTDPFSVTEEEWQKLLRQKPRGGISADNWLLSQFSALSPLICRELAWRAYGSTDVRIETINDGFDTLRREFFALIAAAVSGGLEPWIITGADGSPRDFSFTAIKQYEGALSVSRMESFSVLLDSFYTQKAQLERIKQRASAALKTVKTARDRLTRKLAAQREELEKTGCRTAYRECGDIITANLHLMKKGQGVLIAGDLFSQDEAAIREIALDPLKTPQQNAAKYYKDYTKAKNAEKILTEQIRLGESELAYLDSVVEEISQIDSESDLSEIRAELVSTGYLRDKKADKKTGKNTGKETGRKRGKDKQAISSPMQSASVMRFMSSSGLQILAGRNNAQNDGLTLKTAQKSDIWLHAQKTHGSHVIISCGGSQPDERTLFEAASIAAYYSSARSGGKAPVDYAPVKHVKKPPGARPGMVTYADYKTIIALPDEELVRKLRA